MWIIILVLFQVGGRSYESLRNVYREEENVQCRVSGFKSEDEEVDDCHDSSSEDTDDYDEKCSPM